MNHETEFFETILPLGSLLIPVLGLVTAVGAVVGGIVGSAIGGWFASKANERIDKSVKQNKKGLFGW
ncbi:hypothetical protein [Pseudolactococcus carnosus]|jgi:membrane protein YqaA with SNARE-associated domain|uniref:hypothetical protein n=1 Tax=Pseudolactococcus carnosus TaxID=2749961 RepID=UPI001FBAAC5F|nr:hypothetical protein [Lactococcus carnosus]MBQ4164676.1 hypothetical protein [Turicibacter sp.]MCJ1970315.1 hypothetical protein [Lactococcus carnosus]